MTDDRAYEDKKLNDLREILRDIRYEMWALWDDSFVAFVEAGHTLEEYKTQRQYDSALFRVASMTKLTFEESRGVLKFIRALFQDRIDTYQLEAMTYKDNANHASVHPERTTKNIRRASNRQQRNIDTAPNVPDNGTGHDDRERDDTGRPKRRKYTRKPRKPVDSGGAANRQIPGSASPDTGGSSGDLWDKARGAIKGTGA